MERRSDACVLYGAGPLSSQVAILVITSSPRNEHQATRINEGPGEGERKYMEVPAISC